ETSMQPRSVAVSLLLAGLLYAQNTATLLVTVLDPSGAVIPRAVIELTTASGPHMSAITDDSGRATLAPIAAGRASIHVVVDGFMGGRLPHKSQIASIRFRLSAYNAEDHDLGFNIVDITTKPGFGAWHGSALFGYGGDTFNARNFFAPVREPQQNRRVDLSLSGPLRRNKTSASLAFDKTFSYDSKTTVGVTPLGSF